MPFPIASQVDGSSEVRGFGGARGDRTPDLYNAIVALSQLSYGPTRESRMLQRRTRLLQSAASPQQLRLLGADFLKASKPTAGAGLDEASGVQELHLVTFAKVHGRA